MKRAKRLYSKQAATKQVAASGGESHHILDPAISGSSQWDDWFRSKGWSPFEFQRSAWESYLQGGSGLIHSSTGAGKTYAALGGPILEWLQENDASSNEFSSSQEVPTLRLLWITPLRALAADTEGAIQAPIVDLKLPWRVEARTGDTSAKLRLRQKVRLPTVLITTPRKPVAAADARRVPSRVFEIERRRR